MSTTMNWTAVEKTIRENIPNLERNASGRGCPKANAGNRNLLMIEYCKVRNALEKAEEATRLKQLAEGGGENCPICLEPITRGLVVLKCSHQFCASCFAQHSRTDNKCGLCRDEFAPPPPPPPGTRAMNMIARLSAEILFIADPPIEIRDLQN